MSLFTSHEFETQFKRLYRPLCLFALRFLERTEDAEDVVQQAFADVWELNSNGSAILHLKPYLYQAVRNRSLSLINRTPTLQCTDALPELADLSEDEHIRQAEQDARLWVAIDRLPPERKKIFLLAKRNGLKYQEIADRLHISVKTVENQMGKALKSLRETVVRIYLFCFG